MHDKIKHSNCTCNNRNQGAPQFAVKNFLERMKSITYYS